MEIYFRTYTAVHTTATLTPIQHTVPPGLKTYPQLCSVTLRSKQSNRSVFFLLEFICEGSDKLCPGSTIGIIDARNSIECLKNCADTTNCKWTSFNKQYSACELFDDACTSGEFHLHLSVFPFVSQFYTI